MTGRMRRRLFVGCALVAAYLVAVTATVALRDDRVRPLYDGFAPPPSYRFVDPPEFFASGNVKPAATTQTIALGRDGSEAVGIATPDGQFVVNLGRGAIRAERGASSITVRITPLAARRLAPVPEPLRANGNAYRVDMSYAPNGGTVGSFAKPGTLLMEIPELGQRLFSSPDAKRWSAIAARVLPPRDLTMTASFRAPGYYVAATNLPELTSADRSSRVALVVGVVTAIVAALIFFGGYVLTKRRRQHPGARIAS